jgi:hypothetical protein
VDLPPSPEKQNVATPSIPEQQKSPLRHPKTGVTVEEAVSKMVGDIDTRSPQLSPVAKILPSLPYQDIVPSPVVISTPNSIYSARVKRGLTPKYTPRYTPKYTPKESPNVASSIHRSHRSDEQPIIVRVVANSDGTYSPIQPDPQPRKSRYEGLTEDELYKLRYDMYAEINRLVMSRPDLDLGGVGEENGM